MADKRYCEACLEQDNHVSTKLNLVICHNCGFVWQADDQITARYDQSYHDKYLAYPEEKLSRLRTEVVECFVRQESGNVLDYGYGTGAYLKVMHEKGWNCYGVEVNPACHDKPWIREPGYFFWPESFDAVTFFDSLEHVPFLSWPMKLMSERTKLIVISTPDAGDTSLRDFGKWRHYRPGEHLCYFNQDSLTLFMGRFGFQPVLFTNFEDLVRRPEHPNEWNILTGVFSRC